ncbi:MAG: hypothetical protein HY692_08080 [Cyanobacteria bacterium NC_groundwater_1444_Ag_S-0.65um_54_12]|nr:hypothetical protein [Cyanobacteria bacterium NC_groundwater_1444_Ag_S-0.65um_54_12]
MPLNVTLDGKPLKNVRVIEPKSELDYLKMNPEGFDTYESKSYKPDLDSDFDSIKERLEVNPDGLDSYGLKAGDRYVIVAGKGFKRSNFASDRFAVNGAKADLRFMENEPNTLGERVGLFFRGMGASLHTFATDAAGFIFLGLGSLAGGIAGKLARENSHSIPVIGAVAGFMAIPTVIGLIRACKPNPVNQEVLSKIAK